MSKIWTWIEFAAWMQNVWVREADRLKKVGHYKELETGSISDRMDHQASDLKAFRLGMIFLEMLNRTDVALQKMLLHNCDCRECVAIKIKADEILQGRRNG